jgi:hypothetical protein
MMYLNSFMRNAVMCIVVFALSTAEPLRTVRDVNDDTWEEYFDEKTQHFYYFNLKTKATSWLLEFSQKETVQLWTATVDDGQRKAEDLIDEMFPVLNKAKKSSSKSGSNPFEALKIFPVDMDELHMRKDVAGKLQTTHNTCQTTHQHGGGAGGVKKCGMGMFDHLWGVHLARGGGGRNSSSSSSVVSVNIMALKAPIAFHHMFISGGEEQQLSRQEKVAQERQRVEEQLIEEPRDAESWEMLGHVWRVSYVIY